MFLPIVNYDFLQTRYKDLETITSDSRVMNVTIMYTPISMGKLRLILHVKAAMEGLKNLGFSDKDVDEVKGIYADTNVYLLAGTIFISSMHVSIYFYLMHMGKNILNKILDKLKYFCKKK